MRLRESVQLMKHSRWLIAAVCVMGPIGQGTSQTAYHSRNLTPQHRSQLQAEINQVESQISTSGNSKSRGPLQQELCKKLIQIEDYDRALRVAQDVYLDQSGDKERRAAHHYLIADIYAQKMKASPNTEMMAQNRRLAYQAAQSVVSQNYPSKWGAGECAQKLLNDLQDPKYMGDVQEWVQKRSSNGCDTDQVNLARSQRSALENGAGRKSSIASRGMSAFRRTGSSLM